MNVGGQAVLEGVMMRSPSSWAVAVRKPDGEIAEVCQPITLADGEAADLPPAGHPRRDRARRVARDRLPRARDLGELRRAGGRRRRRGQDRAVPRAAHLRVRDLDRLRRDALQGRPGADHEPHRVQVDGRVRDRRGPDPRRDLHPLPVADLAAPRPAPRLPVPRGRAQGDQRLRGRGGADARSACSASASSTRAAGRRSCSG